MESNDNAAAARTCLVVVVVAALLVIIALVLLLLGLAPFDVLPQKPTPPPDQQGQVNSDRPLVFTIMDVGQGLCVVVIAPDGHTLVADGGRSGERMEQYIIPYLREHGVTRVDYVVSTNPDQDHLGGLERLLQLLPVGAWVDPVVPNTNLTYARELELVQATGITPIRARRGGMLDMGPDVTAQLLWPVDPLLLDGTTPSHNDNSVVLKLTFGRVSFIISGDIEEPAERQLVDLDSDAALHADVLVVGHHGSKTSSSADWLDAVAPSVALIGVGLNNEYGHPHDEVLQRLRYRGIDVYRTDLDGSVEILSDGDNYDVRRLGAEATP
jgi:competence protein ComEC